MDEVDKLMLQDFTYPDANDDDFQEKIFRKLEFNTYAIPPRPKMNDYVGIEKYRTNICARPPEPSEHQKMLANYINPNTPYKGLLIQHGLGTGKTIVGISIAEQFIEQVTKYNTKIHIILGGPILKQGWKDALLKFVGHKYSSENIIGSSGVNKDTLSNIMRFYRILSYKSFYKKVLGEKIVDNIHGKGKNKYKRDNEGNYERDLSIDRIYELSNSLLIVDEAHNLTDNAYGDAVKHIIDKSSNLKILLMTATPMKNLADDIVYLINLLRPSNDQMDRNMIFTSENNHEMTLKPGGELYFRGKIRGCVSYLRGADPLIFARGVEMGDIPASLKFTKIIPCVMSEFQNSTYDDVIKMSSDALDRNTGAISNFAFPVLCEGKNNICGAHGKEGLTTIKIQLRNSYKRLNDNLREFLKISDPTVNAITLDASSDDIGGEFLHVKYLKIFSAKFSKALHNLEELVHGKKGPCTSFVYSNLVKVGINLFRQVLLYNGYAEYDEIKPQSKMDTKCYYCGIERSKHQKDNTHEYHPATFLVVTGKSTDGAYEMISENSMKIINNVFNNNDNIEGKNIKFLLGSKVVNEGINLFHVKEVHILDAYFNLGRIEQVIGRAIRRCSHYELMMQKDNPYPEVNIYKYVATLKSNIPSAEEMLYQKAEKKHLLVKRIERIMKEEAVDCPLNRSGNIMAEDIIHKDCVKNGTCPAICDYTTCTYKCACKKLEKYYDEKSDAYIMNPSDVDRSTFTYKQMQSEISFCKNKIKELYLYHFVYTLDSIVNHVSGYYTGKNFNKYYVYKALDELIPIGENDFNNFRDAIIDKYSRLGYLIYVNHFYIYQPFNKSQNLPVYYREHYDVKFENRVSLYDYIKTRDIADIVKHHESEEKSGYDFDRAMEYYANRKENDIVGIIDKEPNKKKLKTFNELVDVFKLREKLKINSSKKRGTGIHTLTGSVCYNSYSKSYLKNIIKNLGIDAENETRDDTCVVIRDKLLELEKYSTGKDKRTYIIIPYDHPHYPFPYNLEDRVEYIINDINGSINSDLVIDVSKTGKENKTEYMITINGKNLSPEKKEALNKKGKQINDNKWTILVK